MRRLDGVRLERLRRGIVTAGCSFALGALTALGVSWHASRNVPRPYVETAPLARESEPPQSTEPPDPQPTATAGPSPDESLAPGEGELTIPVDGVRGEHLRDTFAETRDGTRPHEALDIMAPRGTPVRAVRDGHIEKLFTSNAGGLTIYQFEPTGQYAYYYAHLDRYAPDLHEGQLVRRGELIGFVGSTGNASPDAPHLHFAIFRLGPDRRWWEGLALNPYPLLK